MLTHKNNPMATKTVTDKNIEKAIKELNASLIGSREMASRVSDFFNINKINSIINDYTDYDYVVEDSEANHKYLEKIFGTNCLSYTNNPYEPDLLTTGIYIGQSVTQEVQFIVKKYSKGFIELWDTIDPEFYYNYIWKQGPNIDTRDNNYREKIKKVINQLIISSGILETKEIIPLNKTNQTDIGILFLLYDVAHFNAIKTETIPGITAHSMKIAWEKSNNARNTLLEAILNG